MKKFLSLVLALVMTMSLVTVAGASFTDAEDVNYDAAVDVMTALEVVGGYADGSFNPEGTLTRGAAAKILCNILVGPETAADLVANTAPYSDVPANHTFAGYIAYCAEKGIISGYADGTFRPAATLTGYAFVKMLLTGLGYDQTIEGYTGTNWAINVAEDAVANGLTKGLDGKFVGNKAITREEACLFALNALQAEKVFYENKGSNIVIGGVEINTAAGAAKQYEPAKYLYETNFETLEKDDKGEYDALGRPAIVWEYDGEEIGTYADTADMVVENYVKKADLDDKYEDLTFLEAADKTAAYATANGKTIELFINDDDEVTAVASYVVELVKADNISVAPDLKSTKDEDERAVTIAGLKVAYDNEVKKNKGAVEIDNFEAVYEAADDDSDLLIVKTADKKAIFSVEVPEVIEAKITRVKTNSIIAGGEEYLLATKDYLEDGKKPSVGDAELTVGANGCVYAIAGVAAEESDVIYLDATYSQTEKWSTTWYAQIVNEDNEIAEVVIASKHDTDADEETEAVKASALKAGFYTYDINDDDEYELTAVAAVKADDDKAMDEDKSYVVINDKKAYYTDDFEVIYIDGTGSKLDVTVKAGAQDKVVADNYILNDDGEIVMAYVLDEYKAAESDEVLFIADLANDEVLDNEGEKAYIYTAYVDGEEVEIMIDSTAKVGFYTYTIDEDTGVYTLGSKDEGYTKVSVSITRDTYVSYGSAIDDAVVTGEIVDLSDEGLATLAAIDDWDGEDTEVKVSFMYDADENEITLMFVELVEKVEA